MQSGDHSEDYRNADPELLLPHANESALCSHADERHRASYADKEQRAQDYVTTKIAGDFC